jgi:hypothetical protein
VHHWTPEDWFYINQYAYKKSRKRRTGKMLPKFRVSMSTVKKFPNLRNQDHFPLISHFPKTANQPARE